MPESLENKYIALTLQNGDCIGVVKVKPKLEDTIESMKRAIKDEYNCYDCEFVFTLNNLMDVVERLCDHILVLDVLQGSSKDDLESYRQTLRVTPTWLY